MGKQIMRLCIALACSGTLFLGDIVMMQKNGVAAFFYISGIAFWAILAYDVANNEKELL